jgi:hypothetical protein
MLGQSKKVDVGDLARARGSSSRTSVREPIVRQIMVNVIGIEEGNQQIHVE